MTESLDRRPIGGATRRAWCQRGTSTAIAMLLASMASAQTAPGGSNVVAARSAADDPSLGEIVVTATRRSERLSKVPISVAAYSQAALDRLGVRTIDDVSRLTPGVTFAQANPGSGTNINIRGISSLVGTATTGIYIDDTPIQSRSIGYFPSNVYPQIFDLDRVEILRGPQGTLFGAGSEGGTVRFITPQPNLNTLSDYGRSEVSAVDRGGINYEGGAAFGIPIVQNTLALRVSGWYRYDAGWIDRVDHNTLKVIDQNSNSTKSAVFRAALTYAPASNLKITPSIYYQQSNFNNTNLFWTTLSDPTRNVYRNGDPLGQPGHDFFILPTLKIDFDAGAVTLVSVTSYFKRRSVIDLDYSTVVPDVVLGPMSPPFGLPGFTARTHEVDRQDNITEEIRLQPSHANARLNWVAGFFYQRAHQTSFEGIGGESNDVLAAIITGGRANGDMVFGPNYQPGNYAFVSASDAVDNQYALYANFDYNITSRLKVTAGARVAIQTTRFGNDQGGPFGGGALQHIASNASASPITPKLAINYQADTNNLFYATAAKGYRIGGGDPPVPIPECAADLTAIGLRSTPTAFGSDSLWSYEIGAKNRLLGGKVRLDSSAYYIDWSNIQQQVFLPNCNFKYVANLGSLTSKGFDLQVEFRPIHSLTFGVAVGYNDSKYNGNVYPGAPTTGPNSVIVSKNDTIDNPPWTVTLTSNLTFPVSDRRYAYLNGSYVYRSRNDGGIASSDASSLSYDPQLPRMSEQNVLNLRMGVVLSNIDVSIFSTNALNSTATVFSLHDSKTSPLFKNVGLRPRVIGLTAVFRH